METIHTVVYAEHDAEGVIFGQAVTEGETPLITRIYYSSYINKDTEEAAKAGGNKTWTEILREQYLAGGGPTWGYALVRRELKEGGFQYFPLRFLEELIAAGEAAPWQVSKWKEVKALLDI